ncbi:hypothetical protein GUJ93_ZPchr0006g44690 [Zizania palustris]|uniref:Uncharacterized protein n=1 Tax=Zizania palustris TaxID=103762 RepID=A0A8J5SLA8_ZIZPA|nr:hypothetical protein GUJ93_ZPchr0006g44690 [Zizania palustris]
MMARASPSLADDISTSTGCCSDTKLSRPGLGRRYTNLEDSSDLISQKRTNVSLICQENKKKRKVHKAGVVTVARKDDIDKDVDIKIAERDESQYKFCTSELQRVSRSEEIMKNFANCQSFMDCFKAVQKLLESENAAESITKLLRDKDIKIMELEKKLKGLSYCSCKKFPIVDDTSIEQKDDVSSDQLSQKFVSLLNLTDLGSSDSGLNNLHLAVEEVSEEFTCHVPERSSVYSDMTGESAVGDPSVISLINEELSSKDSKIAVQVVDKTLARPESCPDGGGLSHASSDLDHPSDPSFTENHVLTCLQSEKTNLSPQFIGGSKKSPIEQCEEELEELHNITVEGIQHNVDTREVKCHISPSYSQQVNSDAVDVSSRQSSLQLEGMSAVQQNPQDLDPQSETCEPTVEITIMVHGSIQPPHVVNDHVGMHPCMLNGKSSTTTAPIVPTMGSQTEILPDKTKDISPSKICNRNNTTRRLRPVSAMMLKEFTGPDIYADTKREERVKPSSDAIGRSDRLIRLLKDM